MNRRKLYRPIQLFIAFVWLVNGLFCKLLNLAPRHEEIVRRILGAEVSVPLTRLIGAGEICLAIWIISGIKSRFCAVLQIILIMVMNILEFILAPDLLLFGRANIIIAALFCCLIYIKEFILKPAAINPK